MADRPSPLADDALQAWLADHPGWEVADGKLHRELRFADFGEAFAFMARVALTAEKLDHHPDWSNVYDRVVIDLSTHDVGSLTELDLALAEAVDRAAGER